MAACDRCTNPTGTREYIVTKSTGDVRRVLCEKCAEQTAETYPVKPARQSVQAEPKDETPPAAPTSTSRGKQKEE